MANPVMEKTLLLLIVTLAFLLVPVFWRTSSANGGATFTRSIVPQAIYFGCLGMAYMILEMTMIMKLNLYLGKPVYGLAVGLFAFLLATGLGSPRPNDTRRPTCNGPGASSCSSSSPTESRSRRYGPRCTLATITISPFWRCLVAVCVLFPLAFPMGMLFPLAMRLVATTARHAIPWFWSINGITSVLGLLLTRGIALLFGLTAATAVALAIYGVAAVCLPVFHRVSRKATASVRRISRLTFLPPNENRSPYQRRTISGRRGSRDPALETSQLQRAGSPARFADRFRGTGNRFANLLRGETECRRRVFATRT